MVPSRAPTDEAAAPLLFFFFLSLATPTASLLTSPPAPYTIVSARNIQLHKAMLALAHMQAHARTHTHTNANAHPHTSTSTHTYPHALANIIVQDAIAILSLR